MGLLVPPRCSLLSAQFRSSAASNGTSTSPLSCLINKGQLEITSQTGDFVFPFSCEDSLVNPHRARVKEHRLAENTIGLVCRLPRAQGMTRLASHSYSRKRKSLLDFTPAGFFITRQRPTFPRPHGSSSIGLGGLNFRVRDGNGCGPSGMATGNIYTEQVFTVLRPCD